MSPSYRSIGLMVLMSGIAMRAGVSTASGPGDYGSQVKPLLAARCYACHGALKQKAGLRLDTGASIRRGGDGGPAVVPGHSAERLLFDRVTALDPAERMPPEGQP